MSSASGIKVAAEVTDAWSAACRSGPSDPVRAIVLHIVGDAFNLKDSVSPSGSFKEDISILPRDSQTCSTYIYRTDTKSGGNWQWILITFVPDNAGVRSKMLHASSKGGLLKSLGEGRFQHNMFFTSPDDLTPSAFAAHLDHLDAPPPMSDTEKALAQIKISEAEEASARVARLFGGDAKFQDRSSPGIGLWSNALKPTGDTKTAVPGLAGPAKGTLKWGSGVEKALTQLKSGHSDGMAVFLHIEPKTETLVLAESVGEQPSVLSPSKLSSKLPPKEPCYTFYAWPNDLAASQPSAQHGDLSAQGEAVSTEPSDSTMTSAVVKPAQASNITLIYTCPSTSPVRYRMIYSSSIRGVMREASTLIGLNIDRKLETSDIADLTESYLKSEIMPSPDNQTGTNQYRSNVKSASTDDSGRRSPMVRQPVRSATAISQAQSAQLPPSGESPVADQSGSEQSSRGELPDSAFSMFGPRVNLSPGGGAGFARPRPAGRR